MTILVNFKEDHSESYKKYFLLHYLWSSLLKNGVDNNEEENDELYEYILNFFDADKEWYNLTKDQREEIHISIDKILKED